MVPSVFNRSRVDRAKRVKRRDHQQHRQRPAWQRLGKLARSLLAPLATRGNTWRTGGAKLPYLCVNALPSVDTSDPVIMGLLCTN